MNGSAIFNRQQQCDLLFGRQYLAEAMKKATAQFEKKHGSAYVVKVSKTGKESKVLNPKLKALLRGIVEQYEKGKMLPK